MKRFILFSLILLTAAVLFGCEPAASETTPPPSFTAAPPVLIETAVTPTPEPPAATPEPTPPPEYVLAQIEALHLLDQAAAKLYAGTDPFLSHALFSYVSVPVQEETLSFYLSEDFISAYTENASSMLKDLYAIDRDLLPEQDTVLYDVLERYLSTSLDCFGDPDPAEALMERGFLYTYEKSLAFYRVESEEDILTLIGTVRMIPSCVDAILSSLEHSAMPEEVAAAAGKRCSEIVSDNGKTLLSVLKERIEHADGISRKQKKAYSDELSEALKGEMIPAFKKLRDGIANAVTSPEDNAYPDRYMKQLSYLAQSDASPASVLNALRTAADTLYDSVRYSEAAPVNGSAFRGSTLNGSISALKKIAKEMTGSELKSTVRLSAASSALSSFMDGPFLLVRTPLDAEKSSQTLYHDEKGKDGARFPEIASVYYPGEALLNDMLDPDGASLSVRRAFPFACFRKGWGLYAAEQAVLKQSSYDAQAAMREFSSDLLYGQVLPAVTDLLIHAYGFDEADTERYLSAYEPFPSPGYARDTYLEAVSCPLKHFSEAYGYARVSEIMVRTSAALGARFREDEANRMLLSIGPCGFDVLKERMDEWAEGLIKG